MRNKTSVPDRICDLPDIVDPQIDKNQIRILGNMFLPAPRKVVAPDASLGSIHKL